LQGLAAGKELAKKKFAAEQAAAAAPKTILPVSAGTSALAAAPRFYQPAQAQPMMMMPRQ
jgi:hypothetical protein